jgi:hypothetical protein
MVKDYDVSDRLYFEELSWERCVSDPPPCLKSPSYCISKHVPFEANGLAEIVIHFSTRDNG